MDDNIPKGIKKYKNEEKKQTQEIFENIFFYLFRKNTTEKSLQIFMYRFINCSMNKKEFKKLKIQIE
jgi:hypothetical protein